MTVLTSYTYGWHTSARNTAARSKGVLVSFADVEPHSHRNQAMLLSIDSPGVESIAIPAMGFTLPDDYWNQPQPCISPDGTHVIWAKKDGAGRVSAYIRRIA